jgi:non-specific serine/threonine protein kinase
VVEICRRLDGLPLAIELAAAKTKLLDPLDVLKRLERRLPLLTGGRRDAPERHRTLTAAIDWSYDLLDERSRELLRALSVFAGSFSLEAGEAICRATVDELLGLVDESLLKSLRGTRFLALETIREYAADLLAAHTGEEEALRLAHADFYLTLAEQADLVAKTGAIAELLSGFDLELDNLRAALPLLDRWAGTERPLAVIGGLWQFWLVRGLLTEGAKWTLRALELAADEPTARRAWSLAIASEFPRFTGDTEQAIELKEAAVAMAHEVGERRIAAAVYRDLGDIHQHLGDLERARLFYEQALVIRLDLAEPSGIAHAKGGLAMLSAAVGDYEKAATIFAEVVAIFEAAGHIGAVEAMLSFADVARRAGDLTQAEELIRAAAEKMTELDLFLYVPELLEQVAPVVAAKGRRYRAAVMVAAAREARRRSGLAITVIPNPEAHSQIIEDVTHGLDSDALEAAADDGRGLDDRQALQLALQELG